MKKFFIISLIIGSTIIKCQDNDNYIPRSRCLIMESDSWIRAEYFESLVLKKEESLVLRKEESNQLQMVITQVTHNIVTKEFTSSCHKYIKTEIGPSESEQGDAESFKVMHLKKQINNYIAEKNKQSINQN